MDLHARKIAFVTEFFRLKNEKVIDVFEKMLIELRTEIYRNSLKPMSMEEFLSEIDQSIEDSNNDRVIDVNELKNKYK